MRLSISLRGLGPLAPSVEVARAAEASGLGDIRASEHVALQAAVAPCSAYRRGTPGPDFGMPRWLESLLCIEPEFGPPSEAEASVVGGKTGALRA